MNLYALHWTWELDQPHHFYSLHFGGKSWPDKKCLNIGELEVESKLRIWNNTPHYMIHRFLSDWSKQLSEIAGTVNRLLQLQIVTFDPKSRAFREYVLRELSADQIEPSKICWPKIERICCSSYLYMPMVKSHSIGYQIKGNTNRHTRAYVNSGRVKLLDKE